MNGQTLFVGIVIAITSLIGITGAAEVVGIGFSRINSFNDGIPTNWNEITADGSFPNLIDESGAATTIDATLVNYFEFAQSTIPLEPAPGSVPMHSTSLADLDTYVQPNGSNDTFVFSDLDPMQTYNVWAIGLRSGAYTNQWTITGATSTSFSQSAAGAGELTFNSGLGDSTKTFHSYALQMNPNASGEIAFDIADVSGGRVAGLAIQPVPEPSGILFAGLMGCFCCWVTRRKARQR